MRTDHNPPAWIPQGYKLRHRFEGEAAGGFRGAGREQVAFLHSPTGKRADPSYPLMVYVTPKNDLALDGTQGRAGTPISLEKMGKVATYHDGIWHIDGERPHLIGLAQARQWHTDEVHSLTIHTPHGTVAVRARRDVALDDLIKIAATVDLANGVGS